MEQLQPIIDLIVIYLPQIFAIATECGLFFVIKALLQRKANEITVAEDTKRLTKQLEVLISDNAALRKQNKELMDKLLQVKNGSDYL